MPTLVALGEDVIWGFHSGMLFRELVCGWGAASGGMGDSRTTCRNLNFRRAIVLIQVG